MFVTASRQSRKVCGNTMQSFNSLIWALEAIYGCCHLSCFSHFLSDLWLNCSYYLFPDWRLIDDTSIMDTWMNWSDWSRSSKMASVGRSINYDNHPMGWVIIGAACFASVIIMGNVKALGVLLIAIEQDLNSHLWLIGWIATLYSMFKNFLGE